MSHQRTPVEEGFAVLRRIAKQGQCLQVRRGYHPSRGEYRKFRTVGGRYEERSVRKSAIDELRRAGLIRIPVELSPHWQEVPVAVERGWTCAHREAVEVMR